MPAYELIENASALAGLCGHLAGERELALDLEMDSLHHYREKVCLMQVSTRSASWLIDPLALDSLDPLGAVLGNPETQVVMHGADYDIRSMHRDFGLEVGRLFDTMIASRFLGIREFGLAALLKEHFGVELDKKYQKADWSKRPLSTEMSAYAVADTAHLLPLSDLLRRGLKQAGRLAWLEEECRLVIQARVAEKEGSLFLSCKGAGKLRGRSLAALENLLQLRDRTARQLDRPPFKVIPADLLIEIAGAMPQTAPDLDAVNGMTPKLASRFGERMLSAVAAAAAVPVQNLPRFPRQRKPEPSEGAKERLKKLKSWRETRSSGLSLEPGVLAPNWLLESVADAMPATCRALETIGGMRAWQRELFGPELLTAEGSLQE